jgi:hypothetical protein
VKFRSLSPGISGLRRILLVSGSLASRIRLGSSLWAASVAAGLCVASPGWVWEAESDPMSIILGSSMDELALADKRFLIKVVCIMSRFLLYGELSKRVVRQNITFYAQQ